MAGSVLAILVLAGCSPQPQAPVPVRPPAATFVGKTLEYTLNHLDGSVASLDASSDLGIRAPDKDPSAATLTVIASCYASKSQLNVAVIASGGFTSTVAKKSRSGGYDSLLTDCQK